MGRWDDRPDDSSDDWRGWKKGKYDGRYRGVKNRGRNYSSSRDSSKAGKFIGILVVIVLGLVAVPIGMMFFGNIIIPETPQRQIQEDTRSVETPQSQTDLEGKDYDINQFGDDLSTETEDLPQPQGKDLEITITETENKITSPIQPTEAKPKISQSELIQFALHQINKDRGEHGLLPVLLSNNQAAQIHAEDLLNTRTISHWMTNGEKPYMTYTRLGGTGVVSQNVGFTGYENTEQCTQPYVICEKIDPFDSIQESEYSMVYDDASSNWGHRDNILRPYHTHVSLGIAYDDYTFVFVQNFEDNYLDGSIQFSNNLVQINGNIREGKILNIGIFYDPLPSPTMYELHKSDNFYELGDYVAIVERPPPPNSYYDQPSDYKLIVANNWQENGQKISINFDTSQVFSSSGVYTVGVWLENKGDAFLITSYSIIAN